MGLLQQEWIAYIAVPVTVFMLMIFMVFLVSNIANKINKYYKQKHVLFE